MRISRTKILPGLIVMWVLAFAIYFGMPHLEDILLQQSSHLLFDYMTWQNGAVDNWGYRLLCAAGRKRGFLISGGEVDTERMAKILLDEFRGGKLGRFTLEEPE